MRSFLGSLLGWFFRRIGSQLARAIMRRRWLWVVAAGCLSASVEAATVTIEARACMGSEYGGGWRVGIRNPAGTVFYGGTVTASGCYTPSAPTTASTANTGGSGWSAVLVGAAGDNYIYSYVPIGVTAGSDYCATVLFRSTFCAVAGGDSVTLGSCGTPAVQYTNCYWAATIQNDQPLYRTVNVTRYFARGTALQWVLNDSPVVVPPMGSVVSRVEGQGGNCPVWLTWTWGDAGTNLSVGGTGMSWVTNSLTSTNTFTNSASWAVDMITNVWGAVTNVSPVVVPGQTGRGTNYADATTATKTMDANQDRRFAELEQLLVTQSQAQRQEVNAQVKQAADIANQSHADAQGIKGDLDGIKGVLDGGISSSWSYGSVTGMVLGVGTGNTSFAVGPQMEQTMRPFAGSMPSVGSGAPVWVLPLHSLYSGMSDYQMSMSDSRWGSVVPYLRSFFLLVVTCGFVWGSFQVVRGSAPK